MRFDRRICKLIFSCRSLACWEASAQTCKAWAIGSPTWNASKHKVLKLTPRKGRAKRRFQQQSLRLQRPPNSRPSLTRLRPPKNWADRDDKCLRVATGKPTGTSKDSQFFRGGRSFKQQPRERPDLQRAERGLPKAAPLPTGDPAASETVKVQRDSRLTSNISSDIPIVLCILMRENYISNLITSPIINTLVNMGVSLMTQRVAETHSMIAGRLSLFTPNWRVITNDMSVLNCIQGYTIDLVSQPHQARPPAELKFSQAETESLTAEVQKMIMKQAVSQIPPQHSNTLIPTFFCPKEGRGHNTHYQPQGSEQICGDSPLQDGGYPHVERYPQNRRLDDKSRPKGYLLHDTDGITPQTSVAFQWQERTFQFNCLPFGLSSAPWVFTKTTRPVVAILRSLGLRVILIMAASPTVAREQTPQPQAIMFSRLLGKLNHAAQAIPQPHSSTETSSCAYTGHYREQQGAGITLPTHS